MVHTRRNTGKIRHDPCRHPLASLPQQYPLKERTWTNLLLNTRERTFNDSMTEKTEAIRCRRYESIVNDRYDFLDKVYIYLFLFATLPLIKKLLEALSVARPKLLFSCKYRLKPQTVLKNFYKHHLCLGQC